MPITNYIANSRISQAGVCTSSTRPASPYEGQVIYETDTDRVLVWNNSAWVDPSTGRTGRSGYVKITPTSATNGTVGTNGDVTFSAVGSGDINNCFTDDFANYRIMFTGEHSSATATAMYLQLRIGSTTAGGTGYFYNRVRETTSSGPTRSWLSLQDKWEIGQVGDIYNIITIDFTQPNVAKETVGTVHASGFGDSTASFDKYDILHTVATAYDSVAWSLASGTFTGTFAVYGYN